MSTFIVSTADDIHAVCVQSALEKKGEIVIAWHWWDFPSIDRYSVNFDGKGTYENSISKSIHDKATIWIHRGMSPVVSPKVNSADIDFVEHESRLMLYGILNEICEEAFCVNPPAAVNKIRSKINELTLATKCGLMIPPTLFSNDPFTIRRFFDEHKEVVMKHSSQTVWQSSSGTLSFPYTAKVVDEHLENDDQLSACPTIFQKLIKKQFELRIVFMGETIFPVKIDSQKNKYSLDWRKDYNSLPPCTPCVLPEDQLNKIKNFISATGLVYGSIDMIATESGEYIFLEVNETGQFLWIEYLLPEIPLLDCFSNLLISKNPKYQYKKDNNAVRYSDFYSVCTDQALEQRKMGHVIRENYGVKFEV